MLKLSQLFVPQVINLMKNFLSNPTTINYLNLITYKSSSGVYGFSCLGILIIDKIKRIIKDIQNNIGYEISISCISNSNIYKQSGRNNEFQNEMFNITDKLCLQPTCEESAILSLVYNGISYKNFPIYFYQINKKFRKELRPRNNIIRCLEFDMKDGYSFHTSADCADKFYQKVKKSYSDIFKLLNIDFKLTSADNTAMLALESEEFIYEDNNLIETKIENKIQGIYGIEIAHIFKLGKHYSEKLNVMFSSINNTLKPIFMNSYGIGIYRLVYIYLQNTINCKLNNNLVIFDICLIGNKIIEEYIKIKDKLIKNLQTIEFNLDNLDINNKIKFAKYMPVKVIIYFLKDKIFTITRTDNKFATCTFEESDNLLNIINFKLNL